MEAAARRLLGAGADRLPALWVERGVFWGEDRVGDAAATARCTPPPLSRWARRRREVGSIAGGRSGRCT